MPKYNWLLSSLFSLGLFNIALPVGAQALLPYTPDLNSTELEKQGIELVQDSIQLIRFQQYELALPRAKLATQLAPNQFQTWFILGTLYVEQKKFDDGLNALQKSRSLAPKEAGILFSIGSAYFQKGDYKLAILQLESGLKIKPNSPEALFDLGNSYFMLKKYQEAITTYDKAFKVQKDFWPAINNIALVKYEQGDIKNAIVNLEKALKIDGKQPEPMLALAISYYAQGQQDKGLKLGETALGINRRYGDIKFLKENLWGDKLLKDAQRFLSTPRIQAAIEKAQQQSSEIELSP